jgi:predicted nuclease of restriction endonuclease-like (RecB) superfamily
MKIKVYTDAIKKLKATILNSRYKAATLVNKELLLLYFSVGKLISEKVQQEKWGAKVIEQLSVDLQLELPGLRGFSATNLKNMRTFFEYWSAYVPISQLPTDQLQKVKKIPLKKVSSISQLPTDQLEKVKKTPLKKAPPISQLPTDQLTQNINTEFVKGFTSLGFTQHTLIITHAKTMEEALFYIEKASSEFWSVANLKHHLANRLFKKKAKLPNNFTTTIANADLRAKALQAFKDEYLFDFINIEDPDEADEKIIESEIVRNIKKFIHSIGTDFAFIANQYRVTVEDDEYFIDLLFFNRKLQCLIAFELKKGKFKPEYAGKLNFYLSALDETVKQPHEQPSIGIILCKEKNNKVVEFSFRDMSKPMGVATYKTTSQLPKKYKNLLPDAETLKKLMD